MTKKIAFVAAISAAFAAVGAITETTDDMTAQGDWEVTVAAGDSNVVTVAQSGSGKIIKKGGGYLVLRKNSTFTGGVEIQAGFVMADPDADAGTSGTVNSTALGTGDVTILGQRSGYSGYCELGIVGAGPGDSRIVTIANNINVTGNTTGKYPALVLYGQNSVLTGKITAAQNFYFWDDEASTTAISSKVANRYTKVLSCTFGEVAVGGELQTMGFCRFEFTGKLTAQKINFNVARTMRDHEGNSADQNNAHSSFVLYTPCEVGEIISGRHRIYCAVENALPGVLINHTRTKGATGNYYFMYGYSPETAYDQTIGGLTSETLYDGQKSGTTTYAWGISSSGDKVLTITGVDPDAGDTAKELVSCSTLAGAFSVTLDAYDGFTQTMSNQAHTIEGTIRAKKGTFRVAGSARFASLKGIAVDAGAAFRMDSTNTAAFPALKTLDIAGDFIVGPNAAADFMATNGYTEIRLASTANLVLPAGVNFKATTLYVDGYQLPAGTWTHANFPDAIPEGVTITSTSSPAASETAEWSGAAESDNLMATMANWKDAPESLDLSHYLLGATITNNGTEMVYADGTKINGINFTRTPAAVPFTIRPATPGAVLEVAGRIELRDAAQLIIKDAIIAPPNRIDQGAARSSGSVMYVNFQGNSAVTTYAASNNVYKTDKNNLPLILDNAVIEKPLYMTAHITGHTAIYCMPGTTNEIKGNFNHNTYQPNVVVPANAMLTFSGGVSYGTCLHKTMAGTMVVKDKPITSTTYFLLENGTLVLDFENMSLEGSGSGDGMNLSAGTLDCRRSFCFNGESMLVFRGTSLCTAELNATTQRVTRLCCYNSKSTSKIHGDPGSLLEVVGGWGSGRTGPHEDMSATSTYRLLTNRVDLAGALSFKMSATNETMTFYSKAFSTCGDLEVSAGTLDFRSDASWLKGTNVAVNGEGRLKVAKGGTFTAKFAELSLADAGVFEIPEGESQTFNYVTTNGIQVASGHYTSLPNGTGNFLAGDGEIVVRRHGIVITLQ